MTLANTPLAQLRKKYEKKTTIDCYRDDEGWVYELWTKYPYVILDEITVSVCHGREELESDLKNIIINKEVWKQKYPEESAKAEKKLKE